MPDPLKAFFYDDAVLTRQVDDVPHRGKCGILQQVFRLSSHRLDQLPGNGRTAEILVRIGVPFLLRVHDGIGLRSLQHFMMVCHDDRHSERLCKLDLIGCGYAVIAGHDRIDAFRMRFPDHGIGYAVSVLDAVRNRQVD